MFNLFGKSEEEWAKEPRRLPTDCPGFSTDNDNWTASREFVQEGKPAKRMYMYAWRMDLAKLWAVRKIVYDLRDNGTYQILPEVLVCREPKEVVEAFLTFEKEIVGKEQKTKRKPLEGSRATFMVFANRHGMHVDAEGNLMEIGMDKPILSEAFIPGQALERLFNPEAVLVAAVDTWEGLHARLVKGIPFPDITPEAFGKWEKYDIFVDASKKILKGLETFPDQLLAPGKTLRYKEKLLQEVVSQLDHVYPYPVSSADPFLSDKCHLITLYLVKAAILVTFLRMAHDIYAKDVARGTMSPAAMSAVTMIAERARSIAVDMGMKDDAKKMTNVIGSSPDPFAPVLLIEAWFNRKPPTPKFAIEL